VVDGSQGIDAFGVEGELTYDDMLSDHCPISVTLKF
jgi:exonuclease III